MIKQMKLKGTVTLNDNNTYTFRSKLHDGTQFEVQVLEHDFEANELFEWDKLTVDGWLFVQQEAQQDNRCYLTLPKPSLQHGKQVLVHQYQLMPRNATLADFRPQRQGGKKAAEPVAETAPSNNTED